MTLDFIVPLVASGVTAAASAVAAVCGWSARTYRWLLPLLLLAAAGAACLCLAWPGSLLASDALVLAAAAAGGIWLGRFLRSLPALVAFAYAGAVVDAASLAFGPTRWLIESKVRNGISPLRYLAVCAHADRSLLAVIGFGDVLLVAAVSAAMAGLGYRLPTALLMAVLGMLTATITGLARGRPMPAIPFLAVALTVAIMVHARSSAGSAKGMTG